MDPRPRALLTALVFALSLGCVLATAEGSAVASQAPGDAEGQTRLTRPDCPADEVWLDRTKPTGERGWATKEEKAQTRARMTATWRAMDATLVAQQVMLEILRREAFNGDPCAVHVKGEGEYGLGPGGLSVRWQLRRWDKQAPPWVLQIPEVSAVVMLRLARSSLRFGSSSTASSGTWLRLQQVYAGRFREQDPNLDQRWCSRLADHGIDCRAKIGNHLGKLHGSGRVHDAPTPDQDDFVLALIAAHEHEV